METTERDVNQHLDKGCPDPKEVPEFFKPRSATRDHASGSRGIPSSPLQAKRPNPDEVQLGNDLKRSRSEENGAKSFKNPEEKPKYSTRPEDEPKDSRRPEEKPKDSHTRPLAEQVRPRELSDFIGQEDLVGENGILRQFIAQDNCPSLILWGPSGVGKTSIARIIARTTQSRFVELSATVHGTGDCKKIFAEAKNDLRLMGRRTILFLDEVHRFNRAQQDIFLPHVERGDVTLIGATTENPSFKLNSALLSRCRVFVLKKLSQPDLVRMLDRAIATVNGNRAAASLDPYNFDAGALEYIAGLADGDGRIAINLLEIAVGVSQSSKAITKDMLKARLQRTHMLYDRVGDSHYDTISAFHKSVRGSDADATLFYLGRMLESGEDPLYIARRMIRIASEDVGLADDSLLPFATATYTAVQQIGMPEADYILAHCAVKLAEAAKSVKVYRAYNKVKALLASEPGAAAATVPLHLRNAPTKLMKDIGYGTTYKYNPDYLNGKVKQWYLPEELKGIRFLEDCHLGEKEDPDLSDKNHPR
ncbi:DNA-dependent ATPase Mgs1p [Trichomonascus vanleenenianus]|uniref:ssDNA-dependent ATPase MGS1 n=1 Tax=Trichomonascus vanleenenianus TaxID=2268995 RepID=UPI003ECAB97B